ncbi:autophagy-related protein 17 [Parasitella parasitica]|nr:autophagy-related protein 17 [Parasitella parasitica]
MEQELIELLLASKKALSAGQSICAQANTYLQTSEGHVETIAKIHPKLLFVDNHILVQCRILEGIREYVNAQTESCQNMIKDREAHLQTLTIELTQIFNLLKKCMVDKDILKVNQEILGQAEAEETHEYTCLFDYISDQDIIDLQRQADDEIGEIESVSNAMQHQSKLISIFLADIAKARKASLTLSLDEETAAYSSEKIQTQEDEVSNMADILTSLTNHYDQLGEATRLYQSDPDGRGQLDITVLEDDHEHIPNILEDLKHSLDIVESVSQEIQHRMQAYLHVRDELIKILNQLEDFGSRGQADGILEKMQDTEVEIKERECNLDVFFEQLANLAKWYRCYASSYNYLLLEIERRRKSQERQETLRQEIVKKLDDAYNDELQERRSWSAQHGQYLPEVLCTFINDSPSVLRVNVERNSTRLPELSPANVKKALTEIHNSSHE